MDTTAIGNAKLCKVFHGYMNLHWKCGMEFCVHKRKERCRGMEEASTCLTNVCLAPSKQKEKKNLIEVLCKLRWFLAW